MLSYNLSVSAATQIVAWLPTLFVDNIWTLAGCTGIPHTVLLREACESGSEDWQNEQQPTEVSARESVRFCVNHASLQRLRQGCERGIPLAAVLGAAVQRGWPSVYSAHLLDIRRPRGLESVSLYRRALPPPLATEEASDIFSRTLRTMAALRVHPRGSQAIGATFKHADLEIIVSESQITLAICPYCQRSAAPPRHNGHAWWGCGMDTSRFTTVYCEGLQSKKFPGPPPRQFLDICGRPVHVTRARPETSQEIDDWAERITKEAKKFESAWKRRR